MQNSMAALNFFVYHPFLRKSGLKCQNYQFNLKFGTYTNLNMQNSVMLFTFLFSFGNTLFGQALSKSKLSV